jgi:hypothetical protein
MTRDPKGNITILIDNKPHEAPKPAMTGAEIKQLGGGPVEYWLILVVKSPDETAGGDDKVIQDQEIVQLISGMRFRIVNPATFGSAHSCPFPHS